MSNVEKLAEILFKKYPILPLLFDKKNDFEFIEKLLKHSELDISIIKGDTFKTIKVSGHVVDFIYEKDLEGASLSYEDIKGMFLRPKSGLSIRIHVEFINSIITEDYLVLIPKTLPCSRIIYMSVYILKSESVIYNDIKGRLVLDLKSLKLQKNGNW